MSIKRTLMLASVALAAIAFAVPATASATQLTWSANHEALAEGEHASAVFKGPLKFVKTDFPSATYECQVTVTVTAIGPTGGKVTEFAPTTSSCVGTGALNGCSLSAHTTNIQDAESNDNWAIELGTNDGRVFPTQDHLTLENEYSGCFAPNTHLEFGEITVTPTVDAEHTITHLTISGSDTTGNVHASGSVTPEAPTQSDPDRLGLITH